MNHNTEKTCAALNRHLGSFLARPLTLEVLCEEEHEGFDNEPVAAVMVNGLTTVYPHEVNSKTVWAVDIIVDASDESVGIYGGEPKNDSSILSFVEAIVRIGHILVEDAITSSVVSEIDEEIAEDERRSTEAHLAAWEEFHKNEGV